MTYLCVGLGINSLVFILMIIYLESDNSKGLN